MKLFLSHVRDANLTTVRPLARGLGASLMALFVVACTTPPVVVADPNPYECPVGTPGDPALAPRPSPSPVVKVIEITDDGELAQRCQWTDFLFELTKVNQSEVVLMYIHGWKHSAADDDSDRVAFLRFVREFTQAEANRTPRRHVVGLFIGWPGFTSSGPLNQLTFWDRKKTADRISQSGVLTKLMGAIENIRRMRNNPDDLTVYIGHSFGARILFTASSQIILYNLQLQHPGAVGKPYGLVRGPADLVVLLNPAFEASIYTALDSVRRAKETFDGPVEQAPVLLTISSTNDAVTRDAYPVGQRLDFAREERQLVTLGNYEPYATHTLLPTGTPTAATGAARWFDHYCQGAICLVRKENDRQRGNPFIVANTNGEVLDGHNGIWMPGFTNWLKGFIDEVDKRRRRAAAGR